MFLNFDVQCTLCYHVLHYIWPGAVDVFCAQCFVYDLKYTLPPHSLEMMPLHGSPLDPVRLTLGLGLGLDRD